MPGPFTWTSSERQAWEYVNSAYESGLNATQALHAYRAGGGHIREQSWYNLYTKTERASEEWSTLMYLQPQDTVPNRMYDPVDINFSKRYVLNFSASAIGGERQRTREMYRYVESDRQLTWGEWQNAIHQALQADPTFRDVTSYLLKDIKFYERASG